MWMTLLEIGKYCFGEDYKGSVLTDFNKDQELFISKQDLDDIIKEYQNTQVALMAKKSRILSIVFNTFKMKGLVRERRPISLDYILED